MATEFFHQSICLQRNSVAGEFYERNVGLVFEKEETRTRMELRCWSDLDLDAYKRKRESPADQGPSLADTSGCAEQSKQSSTTPAPTMYVIVNVNLHTLEELIQVFYLAPRLCAIGLTRGFQATNALFRVLYGSARCELPRYPQS